MIKLLCTIDWKAEWWIGIAAILIGAIISTIIYKKSSKRDDNKEIRLKIFEPIIEIIKDSQGFHDNCAERIENIQQNHTIGLRIPLKFRKLVDKFLENYNKVVNVDYIAICADIVMDKYFKELESNGICVHEEYKILIMPNSLLCKAKISTKIMDKYDDNRSSIKVLISNTLDLSKKGVKFDNSINKCLAYTCYVTSVEQYKLEKNIFASMDFQSVIYNDPKVCQYIHDYEVYKKACDNLTNYMVNKCKRG